MMSNAPVPAGQYALINGLQLYYELHGSGQALVLLHGGGSTIQSNYGFLLPVLAQHFRVIAVELQAHGHTGDRATPLSFEQDADDVVALLDYLQIKQAAIMGFSNGGTTALQCAIRHPTRVRKLVLASALALRSGMQEGFFEGMAQATMEHMPQPLQEAYLAANPDPAGLETMFHRDVYRMQNFKDIAEEDLRSIQVSTLIINGDREVILAAHALFLAQTLPQASLLILPCGHGEYIAECCSTLTDTSIPELTAGVIRDFLAA
jgi:pimeloyl-ACP methyl ester carboxylesterase